MSLATARRGFALTSGMRASPIEDQLTQLARTIPRYDVLFEPVQIGPKTLRNWGACG
jgi:hypothetical protein